MTAYQFLTYVGHFITAGHFRGHGIHSPYLYDFIRSVVIRKGDIVELTRSRYPEKEIEVCNSVEELFNSTAYISFLMEPFRSSSEHALWKSRRAAESCLSIHLPHHIIIFRDPKLNNQHFSVRR